MTFWNQNDLMIMETREKIISLKEEFDKKNGNNIDNYSRKLNNFLDRRLKQESDLIFKRHMFLSILPLYLSDQKAYK